MTDILKVDLIAGNAEKAVADTEKFRTSLVKTDATAKTLDGAKQYRTSWDETINAIERKALNLGGQLKTIGTVAGKTPGLDGIGRAAARADAEVHRLYNELQTLQAAAAKSRDPKVFAKLQSEASKTSAELDKLQRKIDRVAAGRQAAAGRRGSGGISSSGASGVLNQAAGLGIPFAGEAASVIEGGAALGLTAATAAAASGIAAAGALIVKYSKEYRDAQETILHREEAIAAAANKFLIAKQDALKAFKESDEAAAKSAQLQNDLAKNTNVQALRDRADFLRKLRDMDPNGPNAKGFDAEAQANLDRANQVEKERTAIADAGMKERHDKFLKDQEDSRKAAEEAEKKRIESVKAGLKAVDDFGKSTDELFARIFASAGANNPFVAVFKEAEQSIRQVRVETSALSADLQKQALDMVNAQNANRLFATRLDSRLDSSDLRAEARGFRNSGGKPFIDPKILATPGGFDQFTQDQFANLDAAGLGSNLNVASLIGTLARAKNAGSADQTVSERLDRQLKVIADLRPENEAQRNEADRKIIALTQGLDPKDLTEAQRNAAAAARENTATRIEAQEKEAKAAAAEQADVQKSIDANIKRLADIAEKDGLQGVIRIINDAEDSARDSLGQRRRASPADAQSIMD